MPRPRRLLPVALVLALALPGCHGHCQHCHSAHASSGSGAVELAFYGTVFLIGALVRSAGH